MAMDIDRGGSDFEMSDHPPPTKKGKAAPKKAAPKKAPARRKAKAKPVSEDEDEDEEEIEEEAAPPKGTNRAAILRCVCVYILDLVRGRNTVPRRPIYIRAHAYTTCVLPRWSPRPSRLVTDLPRTPQPKEGTSKSASKESNCSVEGGGEQGEPVSVVLCSCRSIIHTHRGDQGEAEGRPNGELQFLQRLVALKF